MDIISLDFPTNIDEPGKYQTSDGKWHRGIIYTRCCRCGRKLRTHNAQRLGFGPVCYKKWELETKKYQEDWEKATHRRYVQRRLF